MFNVSACSGPAILKHFLRAFSSRVAVYGNCNPTCTCSREFYIYMLTGSEEGHDTHGHN